MADWISKIASAGINLAATAGPKTVASLVGLDSNQLEDIIGALGQPTLCFIPIMSEKLTVRRMADIGTTMLISQTDQTKEYITDNAAPRPRTWTGKGYITSLVPIAENGVLLKPSLLVQQAILEAAADSRQPVKFKTDMGEVVDVLISDLQISSSVKGAGIKEVSFTVQEVKILENLSTTGDVSEGLLTGAAAKSIAARTVVNVGGGTALYSGLAISALELLKTPADLEKEIQEEAPVSYAQDDEPVEETPITLNLVGQDTSGAYTYSTFCLAPAGVGDNDTELQQTFTVNGVTFLVNMIWTEIQEVVADADGTILEPAIFGWVLTIDTIAASSEDDIPQRDLTLYPNTLHFDGDEVYTVAIISKLETIGHGDLQDVYITIGVKG